jgi:hypothetical protein
MNRRRSLTLLIVLLSLISTTGVLRAAEPGAFSVALQYTPGDRPAHTAAVPHALENQNVYCPLQISDTKTWVISISVSIADGTFFISATDYAIVTPSGPATVFSGLFKLTSGKQVTLLKTSSGTLDVTITKD